jgi:hypothetical protein
MKLILFISILPFAFKIAAQNRQLKIGFGNYEGFNVGFRHTYEKWTLEYGLGNDFNIYGQGYFTSLHGVVGKQILKNSILDNHQLFANFRSSVWNIENKSNVFSAVSLSAELFYKFKVSRNYQLGVYGGIIWSSVFRYERKNFQDIGYPKEWQPNFGFSLYYILK